MQRCAGLISSYVPGQTWKSAGCRCCYDAPATQTYNREIQDIFWPPITCVASRFRRASTERKATCIRRVADALAERLRQVDPANSAYYVSRLHDFQHRWGEATDRWEDRALPLAGMRLASHHRSFSYLADWLDLDIVATLEPKPGIPASGAQLAALLEQLSPHPPVGVIRTPYENEKPSKWLVERLDSAEIMLPFTIGGTTDSVDLFSLYDETIRMLEEYIP